MGIFSRFLKLTTIGGAATAGGFFWYTRNDEFVPLPLSDRIFHSARFNALNPLRNPTMHDLCIRKVPLSEIDPVLLEKKGKLVEAFCAGVWSGWGASPPSSQRGARLLTAIQATHSNAPTSRANTNPPKPPTSSGRAPSCAARPTSPAR
jgi:hypothetical protein